MPYSSKTSFSAMAVLTLGRKKNPFSDLWYWDTFYNTCDNDVFNFIINIKTLYAVDNRTWFLKNLAYLNINF